MTASGAGRSRKGRRFELFSRSVLLASLVALVGCSVGQSSSTGSVQGDVLNLNAGQGLIGLNPANSNETNWFLSFAYDTLLNVGPGAYDLRPGLATAWSWSSDALTFDMTLRQGVKFSDGAPFNADAVVTWLNYFEKTSPGFGLTGDFAQVSSIQATSAAKVEIKFKQPSAGFALRLSGSDGWVTSPTALQNPSSLDHNTFGVGPYVLDAGNSAFGDHYTYIPNPLYYDKSRIHYKKIVVRTITNADSALEALKTGQIDFSAGDLSTADAAQAAGLRVLHGVGAGGHGILLMDHAGALAPPLGDVRVRQALNYAIDRTAITKAVLGTFGAPTEEFIQPGEDGYVKALDSMYPYNPEKAKQLLAAAGYANGFTFSCICQFPGSTGALGQAVAGELAKVGVTMKLIVIRAASEFTQAVGQYPAFAVDISEVGGWPTVIGCPVFFETNAFFNPHHQPDSTINDLCSQLKAAPVGTDKATKFAHQLNTYLSQIAWWIPIGSDRQLYFSTSKVAANSITYTGPFTVDLTALHP